MRVAGLAITVLGVLTTPAGADWAYTRWGMTPEQVAAASRGNVKVMPADRRKKIAGADLEHAAEGAHTEGSLRLLVGFSFDTRSGGLACVSYRVHNKTDNAALQGAMVKLYGPPQSTSGLPAIGMQTLDWKSPDDITLTVMNDSAAFALHCANR